MTKLILVALCAVAAIAIASDEPTKCYECSQFTNWSCKKPNLDKVGIQSCDKIPTHKNTTAKVVCYTVTASWIGFPVVERGCYYQEVEGDDLCTYFNRTEANVPFTKDYKCNLCYDDLCNGLPASK